MNSDLSNVFDAGSETSGSSEMSIAEIAVRTLIDRLEEVDGWLRETSESATPFKERVHQLRVASRRAVAVFDFFHPFIHKVFRRRAVKLLKQLRSCLGRLRDYDVMVDQLEQDRSKNAKRVSKLVQTSRKKLIPITKKRMRKISEKLNALRSDATAIPLRTSKTEVTSTAFRPWALDYVETIAHRFIRSLQKDDSSAESTHQLRIHAKKLRYSLEILLPIVPDTLTSPAYARLQALQSLLGDIQDGVVQQATLHGLCRKARKRWAADAIKKETRKRRRRNVEFLRKLDHLRSSNETDAFEKELAILLERD